MKTTNYEISKKLQEIGFEADFDFCYSKKDPDGRWNKAHELDCWGEYNDKEFVPSYDLETIINALPRYTEISNDDYFFLLCKNRCGYYPEYDPYSGQALYDMDVDDNEVLNDSESLADTAARLLIKLVEEGIINLKEEK